MIILRLLTIGLATLILGSAAIATSLLWPRGRAFDTLARTWSRIVLGVCSVRFTVSRDPLLDTDRPAVYIANHQSLLDVPALALAMPTPFRFVAKRELRRVPIFGWALWLAGFVFVDRGDRERAIRSLHGASCRLAEGISIIVFPEGTRSPDGRLLPFKKGGFILALESGAPVVPVTLRGGRAILPKGRLRLRPGTIDIAFGPPIDTRSYTYATRDALIDETRRRIANGLDSPLSQKYLSNPSWNSVPPRSAS